MPNNVPLPITHEEIAALAYEYWQQRGDTPGSAHTDWLRAEQDLLDSRQTTPEPPADDTPEL